MGKVDRQVLMAPDVVARAAAAVVADREQRWMLRQPRDVRRSYARSVLGRSDEKHHSMRWMLRQRHHVRESFVRHVLGDRDDYEAREQRWMLRQPDDVRLSYLSDVLEAA